MLRALFLLLCLLAAPGLAAADETAERDAIQAEVKAAFWAGDFGRLDAMADGWRDGAARTGSGRWKLGLFYATFSSAPTILGKDVDTAGIDRLTAQADAWVGARPDSLVAPVVKGYALYHGAWLKRGNGFVAELGAGAMQAFLDASWDTLLYLDSVREREAREPQWYVLALETLLGVGAIAEFDATLDDALEYHPRYDNLAFVAVRRNQARWGGSPDTMEATARRFAAAAGSPAEGDVAYARFYWSAATGEYRQEVIAGTNADWKKIRAGFRAIVADYPEPLNLNRFAWFACIAQDKPTTRELLTTLGDRILPEVWEYAEMPQACLEWSNEPDHPAPAGMPEPYTFYIALAFEHGPDGALRPAGEPAMVASAEEAVKAAEKAAPSHAGAIAWRIDPPREAVWPPPEVLFQHGEVISYEELSRRGRR